MLDPNSHEAEPRFDEDPTWFLGFIGLWEREGIVEKLGQGVSPYARLRASIELLFSSDGVIKPTDLSSPGQISQRIQHVEEKYHNANNAKKQVAADKALELGIERDIFSEVVPGEDIEKWDRDTTLFKRTKELLDVIGITGVKLGHISSDDARLLKTQIVMTIFPDEFDEIMSGRNQS